MLCSITEHPIQLKTISGILQFIFIRYINYRPTMDMCQLCDYIPFAVLISGKCRARTNAKRPYFATADVALIILFLGCNSKLLVNIPQKQYTEYEVILSGYKRHYSGT